MPKDDDLPAGCFLLGALYSAVVGLIIFYTELHVGGGAFLLLATPFFLIVALVLRLVRGSWGD
jgi:high-affinity Fe2+/Pb2+ permease